jgi:hypothetical protein
VKLQYPVIVLVLIPLLGACEEFSSPMPGVTVDQVIAIQVDGTTIDDSSQISFALTQLQSLRERREGKVNPEFRVRFELLDGELRTFRVGQRQIGPDVPASTVTTRWYFDSPTLYEFFQSKRH